jgi:hypothetical protein
MRTTNKTVLDLKKVQHATFNYRNQYGQYSHVKPKHPTVAGAGVSNEPAMYHHMYPGETMLERAKRRNLLDVWTPVVEFQLTANHSIAYIGDKAVSLWKEWNRRIFSKQKKGK